tara:strand:+ start:109 stop:651 length:543 start_codon:yes stop_codon:yes gene_type:complete
MSCFLCGGYSCSEEAHQQSNTHLNNYLNYLLTQRENKINLKTEEQFKLENEIAEYRNRLDMCSQTKEFDCGGLEDGSCDSSFETLEEAIEHERTCLNFTRPVCKPVDTKKYISNLTLSCENCGKVFKHTKLHPKYALNRHKKSCSGNKAKNCKTILRNFANNATEAQLLEVVAFLNKFNG